MSRCASAVGVLALVAIVVGVGTGGGPESADTAWAGHGATDPPVMVGADDVARIMATGDPVVLLDLRPLEMYRRARVPGARPIPLDELPRRKQEVPRTGRVVLYAATLEEATAAYHFLRGVGHRNVAVLDGGIAAWVRVGLPVEPVR